MLKLIPLAFSLGLGAIGCSADAEATGQFSAALKDAQSENALHASRCLQADSLDVMATEMARYHQAMPRLFDAMESSLSDLGPCYSGDPAAVHDVMSMLRANQEAHCQRMTEAPALETQVAECQKYTDRTRSALDHMSWMMVTMGGHCTMM